MWIRGTFLIMFALFIDGAQILVGWAFVALGLGLQLITPAGGAVGGAAAGAYLCWNSSAGIVSGIVSAIKCGITGAAAGALVSAFGVPIGTGLGFIVDICISLTMGGGLILALIMSGMFYPKYLWSGSVIEFLPGFDMLPAWTAMVVLSLMEKSKESGGVLGTAAGVALAVEAPSFKNTTSALQGVKKSTAAMQSRASTGATDGSQAPQERAPSTLQAKNFDGITKPANDNHKPYVPKAA